MNSPELRSGEDSEVALDFSTTLSFSFIVYRGLQVCPVYTVTYRTPSGPFCPGSVQFMFVSLGVPTQTQTQHKQKHLLTLGD